MKHLQKTTQTLTRVIDTWQSHVALTRDSHTWQSTSEVNGQRLNRTSKTNFAGIYKTEDQICELNYGGTKFVIGDKVEDQFYNFTV